MATFQFQFHFPCPNDIRWQSFSLCEKLDRFAWVLKFLQSMYSSKVWWNSVQFRLVSFLHRKRRWFTLLRNWNWNLSFSQCFFRDQFQIQLVRNAVSLLGKGGSMSFRNGKGKGFFRGRGIEPRFLRQIVTYSTTWTIRACRIKRKFRNDKGGSFNVQSLSVPKSTHTVLRLN